MRAFLVHKTDPPCGLSCISVQPLSSPCHHHPCRHPPTPGGDDFLAAIRPQQLGYTPLTNPCPPSLPRLPMPPPLPFTGGDDIPAPTRPNLSCGLDDAATGQAGGQSIFSTPGGCSFTAGGESTFSTAGGCSFPHRRWRVYILGVRSLTPPMRGISSRIPAPYPFTPTWRWCSRVTTLASPPPSSLRRSILSCAECTVGMAVRGGRLGNGPARQGVIGLRLGNQN